MLLTAWIGITINGKPLTTVSDIQISNDTSSLGTSCEIELPINAILGYKQADFAQPLRTQIQSGYRVIVTAGYDELPNQSSILFDGYVYDFIEGTPSRIRCNENYFFTLNSYDRNFAGLKSFKSIINDLIDFVNTDIDTYNLTNKTHNPHVSFFKDTNGTNIDFNLQDVSFVYMSPSAALDYFTHHVPALTINLINNQLYCNVASNFTQTVKLDTRYNVTETSLQRPATTFSSFKLKMHYDHGDGTKTVYDYGDPNGMLKEQTVFHVPYDPVLYKRLAKEAIVKFKQNHYNGKVKTKLYPETGLFWRVEYHDESYPDKSGVYTIVAQDISINANSGINKSLTLAYLLTP